MRLPTGLSEEVIAELLQVAARMAVRWCPSQVDAQDVAQDAVMRLLTQKQLPENVVTWLFVVTRRLAHRRTLRERSRAEAESAFADERDWSAQIDQTLDVESVLARLKPTQRTLLLYVAEGWGTRDIAHVLGCAPGNVGTMVARARAKARQISSGRFSRKRQS